MSCNTFLTYMYNASNIISTFYFIFHYQKAYSTSLIFKKKSQEQYVYYIHLKKFCHILLLPHTCTYISQSNISSFRLKTKIKTKAQVKLSKKGETCVHTFQCICRIQSEHWCIHS